MNVTQPSTQVKPASYAEAARDAKAAVVNRWIMRHEEVGCCPCPACSPDAAMIDDHDWDAPGDDDAPGFGDDFARELAEAWALEECEPTEDCRRWHAQVTGGGYVEGAWDPTSVEAWSMSEDEHFDALAEGYVPSR